MDNLTPLQFYAGIIAVLIPNIYLDYNSFLTYKVNLPANRAQAKVIEDKSRTESQDRLLIEYDRQTANLLRIEDEVRELRPLALTNAILERDIQSCKEDKNDWKQYASRLTKQLEGAGLVPLPFRRTPSDGDTEEKIAVIKYPITDDPNKLQTVQPIVEEKK